MQVHLTRGVALLAMTAGFAVAAEDRALTPAEARKKVGQKITIEMTVRSTKDRLDKRGEIISTLRPTFATRKILPS